MRFLRKKEGIDILDLTLLQKKGILKIKPETTEQSPSSQGNFIDFTGFPSPEPGSPAPPSLPPSSSDSSPFGLLDSLSNNSSQSTNVYSQPNNSQSNSDLNTLKIKIEDLEYKLERLIEKLNKIESDNLK